MAHSDQPGTSPTAGEDEQASGPDAPYVWDVDDGPEVVVVIDGAVDVHHRVDREERVERLDDVGDEHVSHPVLHARTLVVERAGST